MSQLIGDIENYKLLRLAEDQNCKTCGIVIIFCDPEIDMDNWIEGECSTCMNERLKHTSVIGAQNQEVNVNT